MPRRVIEAYEPGQRVTVVQQIPHRARTWTTRVTGTIVRAEQKKTGSWYAHSKDDKLWLDRLILKKDDGEIVTCVLDKYSRIEPLGAKVSPGDNVPPASQAPPAEGDAGEKPAKADA